MTDYIFCPLCGEHEWRFANTRESEAGRVTEHKCIGCNKFYYSEVNKDMTTESGLKIYYREPYVVEATVDEYFLRINHHRNTTEVFKDNDLVLDLQRAVTFDWYREQNIKDKIKKFLVFS